jgi:hypothetical protein
MDRTPDRAADTAKVPDREVRREPPPPRRAALQRLMKRRSYDAQKALLGTGTGAPAAPGEEMDLARAGFKGDGGRLPHGDTIQAAFGPHDLSHARAHVAPEQSRALGAEAYAVGSDVAFSSASPSLHTAAHEAAHVVQQASGVQLKGDVGQAGDAYERHADAVADRVVAGRSAADLLGPAAIPGARSGTAGRGVQKKETLPKGEKGFERMWAAHPHNDQEDPAQNTPSEDILSAAGLPASYNTCAIRMSIMLNQLGLTITPQKTAAAGIKRRPAWIAKKKQFYILAAAEMWQYLMKHFRAPDMTFPKRGAHKDAAAFDAAWEKEIKTVVASRKGIVAFEKLLTGYTGTGHMDLFDGEKLSDSSSWYPSAKLHLWFVVVP